MDTIFQCQLSDQFISAPKVSEAANLRCYYNFFLDTQGMSGESEVTEVIRLRERLDEDRPNDRVLQNDVSTNGNYINRRNLTTQCTLSRLLGSSELFISLH